MALTYSRVQDTAAAATSLCKRLADLHADVRKFVGYNQSQAIDWAAQELPGYIVEENTNLSGFQFDRADVANAIGSLAQLDNLLSNQAVSQGNHLGNLHKLTTP